MVEAARPSAPARRLGSGLLDVLPRGHAIPDEVWRQRHRWVTSVLVVSTALLGVLTLVQGCSAVHALVEMVGPGLMLALACTPRLGRRARSSATAVGLMLVASLAVHLADGLTEAHFLFFVMVPVVALYEAWTPFGLAVAYVLFQHGVVGMLHAPAVYDHTSAQDRPWLWAVLHSAMFAASCLGSMVNWRLQEQARQTGDDLLRARTSLSEQLGTDPLTGLRNRLHLSADLERVDAGARTAGTAYAVAMCDLDAFKAYNDTYGHAGGDDALQAVAATLSEQLRAGDRIYRYGGEEFLVLLPDTTPDQAQEALDRVRATLERLAVEHRALGPGAVLTISVGLAASQPGSRPTVEELLACADAALYAAKGAGRNRTLRSPAVGPGAR